MPVMSTKKSHHPQKEVRMPVMRRKKSQHPQKEPKTLVMCRKKSHHPQNRSAMKYEENVVNLGCVL